MNEALVCVNHPGTETLLCCGSCMRPVCTDCCQNTNVGTRCLDCLGIARRAQAAPVIEEPERDYLVALGGTCILALLIPPVVFVLGFLWLPFAARRRGSASAMKLLAGGLLFIVAWFVGIPVLIFESLSEPGTFHLPLAGGIAALLVSILFYPLVLRRARQVALELRERAEDFLAGLIIGTGISGFSFSLVAALFFLAAAL